MQKFNTLLMIKCVEREREDGQLEDEASPSSMVTMKLGLEH